MSEPAPRTCPLHRIEHITEPHPHKPGEPHQYCPECRNEAIANYDGMPEEEIKRRVANARDRLEPKHKLKGTDGNRFVLDPKTGLLVPRK